MTTKTDGMVHTGGQTVTLTDAEALDNLSKLEPACPCAAAALQALTTHTPMVTQ